MRRGRTGARLNLLSFILGCLIVVPVCLLLGLLTTIAVAQHPVEGTLVAALTLLVTAALAAVVLLLHLLVRAIVHPLRHQVCPECRSDVAATAAVCRYCRAPLMGDETDGDAEVDGDDESRMDL